MKAKTFKYKGKTVTIEISKFSTAWNGDFVRFHYYINLCSARQRVSKDCLRLLK